MNYHNHFLTIETLAGNRINLNVTFKKKRPSLEEIKLLMKEFDGSVVQQITYLGKTDTEIRGKVEYEHNVNYIKIVAFKGIRYGVVAVDNNSCDGCSRKGRSAETSCSDFQSSVNCGCSNKIFVQL